MLLIHGNILTMEELNYPDGYLQIEGGVIKAIGPMSEVPADETVVDLDGKTVLPGFVDAHSHLGMWEDGLGFEGDDGNESTDPVTPQLRAIDALNPLDRTFEEARRGGVTTVLTGPGSANPISGQWAAVKTWGRRIDDMVLDPAIGMKFALGENPKTVYNDKNTAPMTRMATASLIRDQLRKAERYLDDKERADEDEDFDLPEYDAKCEALIPVLEREQKAFFHAHRADDIFTAIRIAREFKLDLVIVHCTEGHLVRDILAAEGVKAIAGPVLCDRSKPELRNLLVEGPALLHEAGIHAALCTDHPVIPIQYLPLCAGLTIGAGLDREEALKSITIYAAEVAGISDRVGSLAPGKDADLVIYDEDADPCGPYAHPCMVFINGQQVV
ncbi:MAG TPA: amidohydrolase [Candidatus Merdivicinus intestinavium]|nr:amidohydrolase [Candidatus Merdivicinus intestinavium]